MVELIKQTLINNKLPPNYISITADNSTLFQYYNNTNQVALLDIYPNKEIILLIEKDGKDYVYELELKDLNFIIDKLKDFA